MRDLAYLWEEEKRLDDRFALFVFLSVLLHAAVVPLLMGGMVALDLDVREIQRRPAAATAAGVIRLDLDRAAPEEPAPLRRLVPTMSVRTPQPLKPPQQMSVLATPLEMRRQSEIPVGQNQPARAEERLLQTPQPPPRESLPLREHSPLALLEESRHRLEEEKISQAGRTRPAMGRIAQKRPRRELHPKRSLLTDPVPSKKPLIPVFDWPVQLDSLELPRIPVGRSGRLLPPGAARGVVLETASPSEAVGGRLRASAKRSLLLLSQPGMLRITLTESPEDDFPESWTREGFEAWKSAQHEMLKAAGQYPRRSLVREEQGVATVRFMVDRTGRLLSAYVQVSSDFPRLDAAALRMVHQAAPFPPFPSGVTQTSILFDVDVIFSLGG